MRPELLGESFWNLPCWEQSALSRIFPLFIRERSYHIMADHLSVQLRCPFCEVFLGRRALLLAWAEPTFLHAFDVAVSSFFMVFILFLLRRTFGY